MGVSERVDVKGVELESIAIYVKGKPLLERRSYSSS